MRGGRRSGRAYSARYCRDGRARSLKGEKAVLVPACSSQVTLTSESPSFWRMSTPIVWNRMEGGGPFIGSLLCIHVACLPHRLISTGSALPQLHHFIACPTGTIAFHPLCERFVCACSPQLLPAVIFSSTRIVESRKLQSCQHCTRSLLAFQRGTASIPSSASRHKARWR